MFDRHVACRLNRNTYTVYSSRQPLFGARRDVRRVRGAGRRGADGLTHSVHVLCATDTRQRRPSVLSPSTCLIGVSRTNALTLLDYLFSFSSPPPRDVRVGGDTTSLLTLLKVEGNIKLCMVGLKRDTLGSGACLPGFSASARSLHDLSPAGTASEPTRELMGTDLSLVGADGS